MYTRPSYDANLLDPFTIVFMFEKMPFEVVISWFKACRPEGCHSQRTVSFKDLHIKNSRHVHIFEASEINLGLRKTLSGRQKLKKY
jgi:hypothetical protein